MSLGVYRHILTGTYASWPHRVMSIPSAAIYMIGYEHLLSLMTTPRPAPHLISTDTSNPTAIYPQSTPLTVSVPSSTSQPYLTPTPFIAGCTARTISATVISPMELFRTRLQALPGPGEERPTYKNTAESIANMMRQRGVTSLWRGLGPTLWRDVPFSGRHKSFIEFRVYESRLTETCFARSLLGRIRVDEKIPHGIANIASRVDHDVYLWRTQRYRGIRLNCAIRRAQNSTSSLYARRHLFATSTQPPGEHTSAPAPCRQDGRLESAVCRCRATDGQSCAGVRYDDWML